MTSVEPPVAQCQVGTAGLRVQDRDPQHSQIQPFRRQHGLHVYEKMHACTYVWQVYSTLEGNGCKLAASWHIKGALYNSVIAHLSLQSLQISLQPD